jgi:hypothetical protein
MLWLKRKSDVVAPTPLDGRFLPSNAPLPNRFLVQATNHATVSDIHRACASVRPVSDQILT